LADVEARLAGGRDALAGLARRWQAEREALAAVVRAREAVRAGGGAAALADKRAADERLVQVGGDDRLIHAEVDVDVVAQVVATWTGIPVGKMQQTTLGTLLGLQDTLSARVRGQADAVRVTAETLKIAAAQIHNPNTPLGVLLFVGPSGVGKTEMATALADLLYGGERFMTTINMSEFQEKHSVSRLIGSPPGYVGYGEGGVLTEAVRQRPYSVVLLDECEKADLEVMNLFYQVFDKGTLSDGEGRIVDFKNTVVILTSNLASDIISQQAARRRAAVGGGADGEDPPGAVAALQAGPAGAHDDRAVLPAADRRAAGDRRAQARGAAAADLGSHRITAEFAPELLDQLAAALHRIRDGGPHGRPHPPRLADAGAEPAAAREAGRRRAADPPARRPPTTSWSATSS
jgi:type VI secretion system protein VasG